jgi:CHAD domain-containing protein
MIQKELVHRSETALVAVNEALDSSRYAALLHDIEHLVQKGPWSSASRRPARSALGPPVRRTWRRVRRRAKRAGQHTGATEHAARLHAVRKAARRARYAGEAVEPVFGKDATAFAERATEIQDILGARHDSAVSEAMLEELAARDTASGHVLVYGRLAAHEQRLGEAAERQWEVCWADLKGRHMAGWLRS